MLLDSWIKEDERYFVSVSIVTVFYLIVNLSLFQDLGLILPRNSP